MRIRKVEVNNQKREFRVVTYSGARLPFPFVKAEPSPKPSDRVADTRVDRTRSGEAFTYTLESGARGHVLLDEVVAYNAAPTTNRTRLLRELCDEARQRVDTAGLSRRELARRLRTSVPQLYRLLDPTNERKSIDQLVSLLEVLGCRVDLVVRDGDASTSSRRPRRR